MPFNFWNAVFVDVDKMEEFKAENTDLALAKARISKDEISHFAIKYATISILNGISYKKCTFVPHFE